MSRRVFIDGSAGTTGLRIADRLAAREELEVVTLTGEARKDPAARAAAINGCELAFLCLPDAAAREIVPLVDPAVKLLDTSTAHRTAPGWVYGLPELGRREAIAGANRVAVPGCHATGFITLAAPLVAAGLLPASARLSCTSLTGYSGGGKSMIADYEAADRPAGLASCRPYALALHHKHLPEMQAVCGLSAPPLFVPVLGDYYCGMLTMVPLFPAEYGTSVPAIAETLADSYAGEALIRVHPLGEMPAGAALDANALAGRDSLEIFCLPSPDGAQVQLISLFDNLGKGSSGAAVQCMNLMLGLEETEGLAL